MVIDAANNRLAAFFLNHIKQRHGVRSIGAGNQIGGLRVKFKIQHRDSPFALQGDLRALRKGKTPFAYSHKDGFLRPSL